MAYSSVVSGAWGTISDLAPSSMSMITAPMQMISTTLSESEAAHLIGPSCGGLGILVYRLLKGDAFSKAVIDALCFAGIDAAADVAMTDLVGYQHNIAPGDSVHITEVIHHPMTTALLYSQLGMIKNTKDNYASRYIMSMFTDDMIVSYMASLLGTILKRLIMAPKQLPE